MALSDYLLCERCNRKAIYDADWYDRCFNVQDECVIDRAALCEECSKTHTLVVVEKEPDDAHTD